MNDFKVALNLPFLFVYNEIYVALLFHLKFALAKHTLSIAQTCQFAMTLKRVILSLVWVVCTCALD